MWYLHILMNKTFILHCTISFLFITNISNIYLTYLFCHFTISCCMTSPFCHINIILIFYFIISPFCHLLRHHITILPFYSFIFSQEGVHPPCQYGFTRVHFCGYVFWNLARTRSRWSWEKYNIVHLQILFWRSAA